MNNVSDLIRLLDAYAAVSGLAQATVSSHVFHDGKRISAIKRGADIGMRRAAKAIDYIAEHWPEGAEWPEGLPRPTPEPAPEAAE